MQTNCLRHFVEVAEKGSISAAAASAFMTPQGLSRSLSSLETELGCSLFSKHQGRMLLTVFGEALLPEAKAILRHEQAMVDLVPSIRSAEEGRVSSGASLYLNNAAFDAALFDPITQNFDGVFSQARYFQCDNKGVVDALLGADDDAVVLGMLVLFSTHAEENEEMLGRLVSEGFTYQSYLESYDEVMVSSRSHLAGKTALTRSDILSEPIISSDGDIRAVCERLFGEGAISMVTSDSSFRFKMVASGKGITFVPAFRRIAAETKEGLVTVPMKNPYYLEVVFAGRAAVLADPVLAEIVATKTITLGERYMENHNKLLSRYEGCIGLKTGYTKAAGRTLVSAAQRMGTTFIAVTLCDPNDWDDHTALLDYAFANYHSHLLARGGKALATVAVEGSLARAVPVVTASEVRYPLTDDEVPTVRIRLPARLKAPVLQGEVVGALVYSLDGKEIGRTDLIAAVSAPDDSAARLNTPRWSFRLPGANVFSPALPRWRGLLSRSGAFLTI